MPLVAPGPIQETSFIEESEAPPPTYSEATGGYSPVSQGKQESHLALINFLNQSYKLGDNCIQNFYLGRYIVRYTVRNLVLR